MYLIDARLEQSPPVLRILNRQTSAIITVFEGDLLQQWIDEGYLYPLDFLDASDTEHLVKSLFLLACSQTLHLNVISSTICLGCRACQEEKCFHWRDGLSMTLV